MSFLERAQAALPIDPNTALRLETALHQMGGLAGGWSFQYVARCGHLHARVCLSLREPRSSSALELARPAVFLESSYVWTPYVPPWLTP